MLEHKIDMLKLSIAIGEIGEAFLKLADVLEPKAETPKAETPKAEKPKAEKPKAEKPKAEKTVNIDAISAKAVAFSRGKAGMADVIRAKMAELGGETLSKIKPEQLAVFEAWLDEQIGGEK